MKALKIIGIVIVSFIALIIILSRFAPPENKVDTKVKAVAKIDTASFKIDTSLGLELTVYLRTIDTMHTIHNASIDALLGDAKNLCYMDSEVTLGLKGNVDSTRLLASKLKVKLAALQTKIFPRIRKDYIKLSAQNVWEDDMYITGDGATNTIINLTAGAFATNKNIAEGQDKLSDVLTLLRFKESRYRWYRGADEYTSYKISSKSDSDL